MSAGTAFPGYDNTFNRRTIHYFRILRLISSLSSLALHRETFRCVFIKNEAAYYVPAVYIFKLLMSKAFLISGNVHYLVSGKRNGVRYQILSPKKK